MNTASTKRPNLIFLEKIPKKRICEAVELYRDKKRKQVWYTAFSVAASLNVTTHPFSTVSLILKYTDKCGEHAVFIDHAKNSKDHIILSGIARLNVVKEILNMEIYAFVPCERVATSLKQLHIYPVRLASEKKSA